MDVPLSGTELKTRVIPVSAGWNLVGSINTILPVQGITSNPEGLMASPFYGYKNGYTTSDTLKPSKGYWVKVNRDGFLFLNTGAVEFTK